jgi:hypothetical protein
VQLFDRFLLQLGHIQVRAARTALRSLLAFTTLGSLSTVGSLATISAWLARLAIAALEAAILLVTVARVLAFRDRALRARATLAPRAFAVWHGRGRHLRVTLLNNFFGVTRIGRC